MVLPAPGISHPKNEKQQKVKGALYPRPLVGMKQTLHKKSRLHLADTTVQADKHKVRRM